MDPPAIDGATTKPTSPTTQPPRRLLLYLQVTVMHCCAWVGSTACGPGALLFLGRQALAKVTAAAPLGGRVDLTDGSDLARINQRAAAAATIAYKSSHTVCGPSTPVHAAQSGWGWGATPPTQHKHGSGASLFSLWRASKIEGGRGAKPIKQPTRVVDRDRSRTRLMID